MQQMPAHEDHHVAAALAMWSDYVETLHPHHRIRKPKTHAAAAHYAISKALGIKLTQRALAGRYHVSSGKISRTYRVIWDTLDLRRDDPRYSRAALQAAPEDDATPHALAALLRDDAIDREDLMAHLRATGEALQAALEGGAAEAAHALLEETAGALLSSVPASPRRAEHLELRRDAMALLLEVGLAAFSEAPVRARTRALLDLLDLTWAARSDSLWLTHDLLAQHVSPHLRHPSAHALFEEWLEERALGRATLRALMRSAITQRDPRTLLTLWHHHAHDCVEHGAHDDLIAMARALAPKHQETALELLEELASHHIDRGTRAHYEVAAETLVIARDLHTQADLLPRWDDFITILAEVTQDRPALVEELQARDLIAPQDHSPRRAR